MQLQHCCLDGITTANDGALQGVFCFPQEFIAFQGHFPGNPLLPGVVQIMMSVHVAAHGTNLALKEVKRCKFTRPVRPQERVIVSATLKPGEKSPSDMHHIGVQANVSLSVDNVLCAAMTLVLQPSKTELS